MGIVSSILKKKGDKIMWDAEDRYDIEKTKLKNARARLRRSTEKLEKEKNLFINSYMQEFVEVYSSIVDCELLENYSFDEIPRFIIERSDAIKIDEIRDKHLDFTYKVNTSGDPFNAIFFGRTPNIKDSLTFVFGEISDIIRANSYKKDCEMLSWEVDEAIEKIELTISKINAIKKMSDMLTEALDRLEPIFKKSIDNMKEIIQEKKKKKVKTSELSKDEIEAFAVSRSIAGAIKTIIDTPVVGPKGGVTKRITKVRNETIQSIPQYEDLLE